MSSGTTERQDTHQSSECGSSSLSASVQSNNNERNTVSALAVRRNSVIDHSTSSEIPGSHAELSHLLVNSYRRPSFSVAGSRAAFVPSRPVLEHNQLPKADLERAWKQEYHLLNDNDLLPGTYAEQQNRRPSILSIFESTPQPPPIAVSQYNEERSGQPNENTQLIQSADPAYGTVKDVDAISEAWERAVATGKIHTTWQREAITISSSALPLVITFFGQYSLLFAATFSAGHLGVAELGAASLGSMSANISGYAIFQGLSTSLDTLCAQAYGSGRKKLVGLQMQRLIYFMWAVTVPIALLWLFSEPILQALVPDSTVAHLAALYLKVLLIGAPGFAAFEAGKRFCQAQGLFAGPLYVLILCAPFNIFMSWFLVWRTRLGFIGAPLSVAITHDMLPLLLFVYVRYFSNEGMECWGGFSRQAFTNWGPAIRLAIPGLLMIEAETLAFEILTFAASHFGTKALAGQAVVAMIGMVAFQIPFPVSIAGSTRLATLIGATLIDAAKISLKVTIVLSLGVGCVNVLVLWSLRNLLPGLFTNDREVEAIVSGVLPLLASFQFFDALAACCNGMLRGLGRQEFGGYLQVFAYYVLALPVSFGLAFGAGWDLIGLWTGVSIGMAMVCVVELIYLNKVDWNKAVEEAIARNEADEDTRPSLLIQHEDRAT